MARIKRTLTVEITCDETLFPDLGALAGYVKHALTSKENFHPLSHRGMSRIVVSEKEINGIPAVRRVAFPDGANA